MDPHEEKEKEATLPTTNTADAPDSGTCTGSAPTAPEEPPREGPGEAEGPLQPELPVDKDEEHSDSAVKELPVDEDKQPADNAAEKKPKSMSGR